MHDDDYIKLSIMIDRIICFLFVSHLIVRRGCALMLPR